MFRKISRTFAYTALVLITLASLAIAGTPGTVVSVDDKGMATVETADGQTLRVKVAGAQIGDRVDCSEKAGKTQCEKAS